MKLGQHGMGLAAALLAVSLGLTTACGAPNSNGSPGGNSGATQQIRIVEVPRLLEMFLVHVADQQGFFKQEHISAQFISVKSGPELVTALLGGNADIGLAAPQLYWPAIQKGENIVSLVGTVKLNYVLGTCGPNVPTPNMNAPFPTNLQDLKDKRVAAIGPGTATEWFAQKLLAAAGLTQGKDVQLLYLGGPATAISACQAGRADFYTFPPPSQKLLTGAKVVADALTPSTGNLFKGFITTVYASSGGFASNGSAIGGFCRALVRARDFARNPVNQDRVVNLLAEDTGITVANAKEVWPEQSRALVVPLTPEVWSTQSQAQRPPLNSYVPDYSKYVSSTCTGIVSK